MNPTQTTAKAAHTQLDRALLALLCKSGEAANLISERIEDLKATNARLERENAELRAALAHLEKAATKFTVGCNCQTAGADDALSASLDQARAALANTKGAA